MKYQFADLPVQSVTCTQGLTDPFQFNLSVRLSDGEMNFLYTPEELLRLTSDIASIGQ
jgi:hypothetical protein